MIWMTIWRTVRAMMGFILSHWREFLIGAASVILAGFIGYAVGHWKGKNAGMTQARIETITKVITIREKQNEIRNRRPDTAGVVDRLQHATF